MNLKRCSEPEKLLATEPYRIRVETDAVDITYKCISYGCAIYSKCTLKFGTKTHRFENPLVWVGFSCFFEFFRAERRH